MQPSAEQLSKEFGVGQFRDIRENHVYSHTETDVSYTYRYQNLTRHPLTVVNRDGSRLRVMLAPGHRPCGEFRVFKTITGPIDVIKNIVSTLDAAQRTNEHFAMLRAIEHAVYGLKHGQPTRSMSITIEYILSDTQLDSLGGRAYMPEVDLLVERQDGQAPLRHPFDRGNRDTHSIDKVFGVKAENNFLFMIRAIDNTGKNQYTHRYVNLGGKIYEVPVERDVHSLRTGIHITTRLPVEDGKERRPNELTQLYLTFEQADKMLNLQHTVEEARLGGRLEEVAKDQLNERTIRMKLEQTEHEARMLREKLEHQTNKEQLDYKLNQQRMLMEWLKVVATLVTTGLTLWAAFRKVKSA